MTVVDCSSINLADKPVCVCSKRLRLFLVSSMLSSIRLQGWRRSLHAYRACEDADAKSPQAAWPTVLFNQHQCGCWGAEIIKANSPEQQVSAILK